MNKNRNTTNFSINKPSYYKLTDKQIKQLLNYLVYKISNEELNDAIGYTYNCPYCDSKKRPFGKYL